MKEVKGQHLPEATRTREVIQPVGSSLTRMMPLSRITEPSVLEGRVLELSSVPYPSPTLLKQCTALAPCSRPRRIPDWAPPHWELLGLTSCITNTGCWGRRGCGEVGVGAGA